MYDKILQENNTYTLSNFNVQNNNLAFKACDHKYMLKWTGGTTADDVNRHTITSANIKFKPFAEILSGKWKADLLVRESKSLVYEVNVLMFYHVFNFDQNFLMICRCHWFGSRHWLLSAH
jgi:hypothetical protein